MNTLIEDLGFAKNIDVLRRQIDLTGKRVVDAGCGSMTFSKILTELGARVLAIDPDSVQAEKNRQTPVTHIEFVETGADKIPAEDQSIDGVFFSYSLHHIPASIYPVVFAEVVRVLKNDGCLYVLEPTDCPLNQIMRLFHDEDREREAAQDGIERLAVPCFATVERFTYHDFRQYESFEDFVTTFSSKSFNSLYTESDVRSPEVESAFLKMGAPDFRFASPKKVTFLQGPKR